MKTSLDTVGINIHRTTIAIAAVCLCAMTAHAIDPTNLKPAGEVGAGVVEIKQEAEYSKDDNDSGELSTDISYGVNRHFKIGVVIPFEYDEEEDTEFGDVGVYIKGILNPDNANHFYVGGEIELLAPTGEDSDNIGGEVQLRLSKYLDADETHGVHLTLTGYYDTKDDEEEYARHYHLLFSPRENLRHDLLRRHFFEAEDTDQFTFGTALGYTYAIAPSTKLTLNGFFKEDYSGDDDALMAEVGLTHNFTDAWSGAIGVGIGLTDESPDFTAKAGLSYKFGGK